MVMIHSSPSMRRAEREEESSLEGRLFIRETAVSDRQPFRKAG